MFNGFAAELTQAQADKLRSMKGVLSVEKDVIVEWTRPRRRASLGSTRRGGLWDQLGGAGSAGENIIIGVIDSGIWPESLSFSDRTGVNGNATKDGKLPTSRFRAGTASAHRARRSTRRSATRS